MQLRDTSTTVLKELRAKLPRIAGSASPFRFAGLSAKIF